MNADTPPRIKREALPRVPALEVIETADEVFVQGEMPCDDRNAFEVSISPHCIQIRKFDSSPKKFDGFEKVLTFPSELDPGSEKTRAHLNNRVLSITVPKITKGGVGTYWERAA